MNDLPQIHIDDIRNVVRDSFHDVDGHFLISNIRPDEKKRDDSLINFVDETADKKRGPSSCHDVYIRLDNVSVDDLLVEKSMLVKWLISRYKDVSRMHKPREMMFAVIESVCKGIEIYLSSPNGVDVDDDNCRYIEGAEIFDGDIFCACNEWMLGFIGETNIEKMKAHDDTAVDKRVVDDKRLDAINVFDDDDNDNENLIDNFVNFVVQNRNAADTDLPPLLRYSDHDVEEEETERKCARRIENMRESFYKKTRLDAEKLRKYSNLNVDVLSKDSKIDNEEKEEGDARSKRENRCYILKLIVDMKELEKLLTFLMYIDRGALYDDIDITFRNKLGTNKPFCFSKTTTSRNVSENCLSTTVGDRLNDIFESITDKHRRNTNIATADIEEISVEGESRAPISDRALEVFEYVTFLLLDKISTTVVNSLVFPSSSPSTAQYSYKFGIVDLIYPKIGRIGFHKFTNTQSKHEKKE